MMKRSERPMFHFVPAWREMMKPKKVKNVVKLTRNWQKRSNYPPTKNGFTPR